MAKLCNNEPNITYYYICCFHYNFIITYYYHYYLLLPIWDRATCRWAAITVSYGEIRWVTSLWEFPKLTGKSHGWHHSRNLPETNSKSDGICLVGDVGWLVVMWLVMMSSFFLLWLILADILPSQIFRTYNNQSRYPRLLQTLQSLQRCPGDILISLRLPAVPFPPRISATEFPPDGKLRRW